MTIKSELQEAINAAGVTASEEDIQKRINILAEYNVPEHEAKRSILTYFGISQSQAKGDNAIGTIANITGDGIWTSLVVKIVQLWDNDHESIAQTGIIGDPTGTVKFTKWASANLPELTVDQCYTLYNVVSSVYNEKIQISLNKKSRIELADEVEVKDNTVSFIGALVAIRKNSGLITRCSVCKRTMGSTCEKHPDAKGYHDMRMIGTLDNGTIATTVIMDATIVENLTGYTVEKCQQIAAEQLDKSIPGAELTNLLLGRFFYATGPDIDNTIIAKTMMPFVKSISNADLEQLIKYIGSD